MTGTGESPQRSKRRERGPCLAEWTSKHVPCAALVAFIPFFFSLSLSTFCLPLPLLPKHHQTQPWDPPRQAIDVWRLETKLEVLFEEALSARGSSPCGSMWVISPGG